MGLDEKRIFFLKGIKSHQITQLKRIPKAELVETTATIRNVKKFILFI